MDALAGYPEKLTVRKDWRFVGVFMLVFAGTYFLYFWWLQLAALVAWAVVFVILSRRRTRARS